MKRRMVERYSLGLLLAVAGVAVAADEGVWKGPAMDQPKAAVPRETPARDESTPLRASVILGLDVYNTTGKQLGHVDDIVLDRDGREIGYIVLSHGGVVGIGDKLLALPREMVRYDRAGDRLIVDLSEDIVSKAPGFDKANWPTAANSDYYQKLTEYFRAAPHEKAPAPMTSMKESPEKLTGPTERGLVWDRRATGLIGTDVRNPSNDELGKIDDFVIDWNSGKVRYLVLSHGAIMDVGGKLFAIPVEAVTRKAGEEAFVLNVTKEDLKGAPSFDKSNWPNFGDAQWKRSINDYYVQRKLIERGAQTELTD